MSEFFRKPGDYQSTNIHLPIVSRGIESNLTLSDNVLCAENNQGNIELLLEKPEASYVRTLVKNPNRAFISSELHRLEPELQAYRISYVYSSFTGKLGPHAVRENFIAFGHGRAKRYCFITDSSDPSELIRRDRRKIKQSEYSDRRISKQLRSYDELEAFYNGSEQRKYSRKKIVGATALGTTITIGGTMYLIYKKTHYE